LGLPAILGMFWGAPLVARELESGTFRLAWTQGRSRLRWLGAKLAVVGFTTLAVQGLLSLMMTWWWSPVGRANPNRFSPALFGTFGVAPIGYAAFALAMGIAAGIVFRRTLPAMAATLAVFYWCLAGGDVLGPAALRPSRAPGADDQPERRYRPQRASWGPGEPQLLPAAAT
jgi:ABC-type transport system involved in multi-copper enzyme maturation permease subunit